MFPWLIAAGSPSGGADVSDGGGSVRDGEAFTIFYSLGGLTGATAVLINGFACTSVVVVDDFNITAVAIDDDFLHDQIYAMKII